jgi:ribosome-binding factor A
MTAGRRTARLAEEIRQEVASLISRGLKDPRIGFVTITRVSLTSDLSLARISFGVLGDEKQRAKTLAGLRAATGFIRREVGRRLRTRITPELKFEYDEGLDATERVAVLLDESRLADEAAYAASEPAEEPATVEDDDADEPGDGR